LEENIAVLILAAGSSSRFKEPKQLLDYNGKSLIEHAVDSAIHSNIGPVLTILGSSIRKISEKLKSYQDDITIVENKNWEKGVSSSIQVGLNEVQKKYPNIYGVLIMLSDQPKIDVNHLVKMIRSHYTFGKNIIASGYGGSFGVPAFFHRSLFHFFDKLEGDHGAKPIISKLKRDVHVVPNPEAELDIDTTEDYKKLIEQH